jgi:hypothetical protein
MCGRKITPTTQNVPFTLQKLSLAPKEKAIGAANAVKKPGF